MLKHRRHFGALLVVMLGMAASFAAEKEHATLIRESNLYSSASSNSEKLLPLERGRDLVVLEGANTGSSQAWLKVTVVNPQSDKQKEITGWTPSAAVVTASTMNADQIIYGEAVNSEQEAGRPRGRRSAAEDALRLYQQVAEHFPNSQLAGEATWRFADIRWQLDKAKNKTKGPVDEKLMQSVIKRFPGSKWADLAGYELLENKMCPEWRGLADCPLKEATVYEQYAREHPQSPKAAEALYNAAWRQAVLADIFRSNGQETSRAAARSRALALAQELSSQLPSEWKTRAAVLTYKLQTNIAVYGVSE